MNQNKDSKVIGLIKNYVDNIIFENGSIQFNSTVLYVDNLKKEIEKTNSDFLGFLECYILLRNEIANFLEAKSKNIKEGKINSVLSQEECNQLVQNILEKIKSIPQKYYCFFKIPNLETINQSHQKITNDIHIVNVVGRNILDIISDSVLNNKKVELEDDIVPPGHYIRITITGYATEFNDSILYIKALSKLKQFLFMSHIGSHLILNQNNNKYSNKNEKLVFIVNQKDSKNAFNINVPDELAHTLNSIEYNPDFYKRSKEYEEFEKKPQSEIENISILGRKYPPSILSKNAIHILEDNTNNEHVSSIKTSLEWAFDATTNKTDKKLAIIQLSIAFEAILGEQNSKKDITYRLSDRCAYLIGKNIKERKQISAAFEDFYDLRSKIVHGTKNILSERENHKIFWARTYIEKILYKEIYINTQEF